MTMKNMQLLEISLFANWTSRTTTILPSVAFKSAWYAFRVVANHFEYFD